MKERSESQVARPRWRPTRGMGWQVGIAAVLAVSFPLILPISGVLGASSAPVTWSTAAFVTFWTLSLHGAPFTLLVLAGEHILHPGPLELVALAANFFLLPWIALTPLRLAIDRPESRGRWMRAQVLVIALYLALIPLLMSFGLGL